MSYPSPPLPDPEPVEAPHHAATTRDAERPGARSARSLVEPRVRVDRVFTASCEDLFDAFVKPERLVQWFVPEHYLAAASECTIELEPGGFWSLHMADPDSEERSEIVTILSKVRAPRLLVGATTAVTQVGQLRDVAIKIRFTADAGRCELRLRQGPMASRPQARAIEDFWADAFSRLDDHLDGVRSQRLAPPA